MTRVKLPFFIVMLIGLAFPQALSSQGDAAPELDYHVFRVYPPIALTNAEVREAKTLLDINQYYRSSWIKEYVSVELSAMHGGQVKTALGVDENLSEDQKNLMATADAGSDISVVVTYVPDNNLSNNTSHEINFTLIVDPETDAHYPDGHAELLRYFKENAIDKIPADKFTQYQLAAVKFSINSDGQVVNAHVFESAQDEMVDEILMEAVCSMHDWVPAQYSSGLKVTQDFVLTVGDIASCVTNTLNIRRDH